MKELAYIRVSPYAKKLKVTIYYRDTTFYSYDVVSMQLGVVKKMASSYAAYDPTVEQVDIVTKEGEVIFSACASDFDND